MRVGRSGLLRFARNDGEDGSQSCARVSASRPKILLADEPAGNLDLETSGRIFKMMVGMVRDTGLSALIATHNPELARQMDRAVTISDGKLVAAEV